MKTIKPILIDTFLRKRLLTILVVSVLGFSGTSFATPKTSGQLTKDMEAAIESERNRMPSETEAVVNVDVDWEITEIKIPYPRCAKHRERISYDLPKFEWGMTRVLGVKTKLPKWYSQRVEIKFDYPRCSKDYKVVKMHLPQFRNARGEIEHRSSNIENIATHYQPLIEKAAISEAKAEIMKQRSLIVDNFKKDIAAVNQEIASSASALQKEILAEQLKMLIKMQEITLRELDKNLAKIG